MKRFLVILLTFSIGKYAVSQTCDTSLWIPNGQVNSLLLRDSLLYVGGTFSQVSPCTGHFVAIDGNFGNVVTPFPFVNGKVNCMEKDQKGNIYVGGAFDKVGNYACYNLFRLDSIGNFDPTFLPNPDGEVFSILAEWSTIFIGGDFHNVGGFARERGAAFSDSSLALLQFDPQSNGPIYSICADKYSEITSNAKYLILGGDFTSIGGGPNKNICKLYSLSGNYVTWGNLIWSAVPLVNGIVRKVKVMDDKVYLAGDFTGFANLTHVGLAILDVVTGNVDNRNAGIIGTVRDFQFVGNQIYFAGNITSVNGQGRSNLASVGIYFDLKPWHPTSNGPVYSLSMWNGNAFCVGGNFTKLGIDTCYYAGIIDTSGFIHPINPRFDGPVNAVVQAVQGGKFWAGGNFSGAGGVLRSNFCVMNVNTKRPSNWNPSFGNTVNTIYADSNQLFVAGSFSNVNGQSRGALASFDLSTNTLTTFNPGVNGIVRTMTSVGSNLFIGGNFSFTGNQTRNNIACINIATSQATNWNPGCAGSVNKVIIDGNHLYVGGFFPQIAGQPRDNLARLDLTTGVADFNWLCNTDDGVYDMNLYNGKLYFGGWFQNVSNQSRKYFGAADTLSGTLLAFQPVLDNYIYSIERLNDDFFISGPFTTVNGNSTRPNLCNYDNFSMQFDAWSPSPNSFPKSMQASQNWLYIGGSFAVAGFRYHPNLAMISVNYVTGISAPTNQNDAEIKLWPNPTDDFVFVSLPNNGKLFSGKIKIQVLNMNGQIVEEQIENYSENSFKIDFTKIDSGMYFIAMSDAVGNFAMKKLIRN